nr:MAG TPA: hypothetical protein [Caudoviricetes sp.]
MPPKEVLKKCNPYKILSDQHLAQHGSQVVLTDL